MSNGNNLGLFWGVNAFSIVESQHDVPQRSFRVPHHSAPEIDPISPFTNVDDIQFISPLKEALKINGIRSTDVNLVLPSKDIVIRSFVIPFLKPGEIKGVVEFEIKKYIPFNLKDLAYSFHTATFVEDKTKRMRVHFVAIRKEILEKYKLILQKAGLNVVYSEPAPMCLVRVLLHRKIIKADQKVVIIHTDFNDPGIIVIDKGIVQFVRDFQLQNPTLNMVPLDVEMLKKKLLNEIKISLDFYIRQFKSEKIGELFTLSFASDQDLSETLEKELDLSVRKINVQSLAKFSSTPETGLISAYGINLRNLAKAVEFNLSGIMAAPVQASKLNEKIPQEYIPIIKVAVVCAALLAVVLVLTKMNTAQFKKQYDAIVDVQGAFVEMTPDELQARITENQNKLIEYKDAYQASDMAFMLAHIAKTLPAGMWLTKMEIRYTKENMVSPTPSISAGDPAPKAEFARAMTIDLGGYAYANNTNEQFKMVYGLVNMLKQDAVLKKYSNNITLTAIQSEQRDDVELTSFKILVK